MNLNYVFRNLRKKKWSRVLAIFKNHIDVKLYVESAMEKFLFILTFQKKSQNNL